MPRVTKRTVDAEKPGKDDRFIWDEDLPGFALKVTTGGRKVYVFQYRTGPGRTARSRRYTIGKHGAPWTADAARKRAEALQEQVKLGIDPMAEKQAQRENTITALISAFIEDRRTKGRKSAEDVRRVLKAHVGTAWGKRPAASITAAEAQKLVDAIAVAYPIQANRVASHLKTMFRWAKRRGMVDVSPAADLEKPGQEQSRDRAPTLPELADIWRAAAPEGYPFGPTVKLLILTGQRRDEVAGMGRAEIDRTAALWTVPATRAKNGLAHDVHLTGLALAALAECPIIKDQDLVFSTTGDTPISGWGRLKERIDRRIQEAREKDGRKPMAPWVLHDLRRSVATGLNDLGVAPHIADRILNHVSRKGGGVAAVYNRAAYAAERKEALKLWSSALERALSG